MSSPPVPSAAVLRFRPADKNGLELGPGNPAGAVVPFPAGKMAAGPQVATAPLSLNGFGAEWGRGSSGRKWV